MCTTLGRPQVKQIQKWVKKQQAAKKKVTASGIKRHYSLTCSRQTIIARVLKSMGQKYLRRSHKPGVPADRPAWGGVCQVFTG